MNCRADHVHFQRLRQHCLTLVLAALPFALASGEEASSHQAANPPKAESASKQPAAISAEAMAKVIDRLIEERLLKDRLTPSPRADDSEFLRRAFLDIAGIIPPHGRVAQFLDDPDQGKRARLIDELLASHEYVRHMTDMWRELLFPGTAASLRREHDYGIRWVEAAFAENKPWDQFVRELLTADGMQDENGAVTFLLTHESVDEITDRVSRVFLGLQLQCAQCHDHPFHDWSQDDYWGLAAFFTKVRTQFQRVDKIDRNGVSERGDRKPIMLPASAKTVAPTFLNGEAVTVDPKEPYLPELARWLTGTDNHYLSRAMANRLWQQFFARGLVEPVDDLRDENLPTHPGLFAKLTEQFQANGYDVKYLMRAICNSQAYQRTSRPTADNDEDRELYSHMAIKVVQPHALGDSLQAVLALGDTKPAEPPKIESAKTAPAQAEPAKIDNTDIEALKARKRARGSRDGFASFFKGEEGAAPTSYQSGLPQALRLMNAQEMGRISRVVNAFAKQVNDPQGMIEQLYLAALARRPTAEEIEITLAYAGRQKERNVAYGDVLWALLNSTEFIANH